MAASHEKDAHSGGSSDRGLGYRISKFFLGDEAKSKAERRLVQKLDFFILTYCCLVYFFNYLDRAAFANAYVAGLQEDLGLTGNDYNVVLSMFTAGSVVGQIPHALIIQKVAPRIWLSSMALVWACLTIATSGCKTYEQLCAVRFLQGFAEASTYCGTIYIIGCWYKPREIAKRTAIFTACGQAGSMFAGLMMTAMHTSMEGKGGRPGWQWVFIINGIVTLPVAVVGYFYFPDIPEITSARWLSGTERAMALSRLPPKDLEHGHNIDPLSLGRRVLAHKPLYIFCFFAVISGALEAYCVQGMFLLWLDYHSPQYYTQANVNTYPLGIQSVGIVSNYLAAVHIDATGRRVPMGILAGVLQLVCACMLLVPSLSHPATFFAYYLSGTSYIVNPVSFGWGNIILQRGGDDAARAVILYAMNASSTCLYTFWGIVLYPASDAPYWKKGSIAMIVVVFVYLAMVGVVYRLDKRTAAMFPDLTAGPAVVGDGGEDGQQRGAGRESESAARRTDEGREGVSDGQEGEKSRADRVAVELS